MKDLPTLRLNSTRNLWDDHIYVVLVFFKKKNNFYSKMPTAGG